MTFNSELKHLRQSDNLGPIAQDLLDDTVAFIRGVTYTTRKSAAEIMGHHLDGMSDEEIASVLNLTHTTVRIARQEMYRKVKALLGEDYLTRLSRGNDDDVIACRQRLDLAKGTTLTPMTENVDPYFLSRLRHYAKPFGQGFSIRECPEEASLIVRHSKSSMDATLERANPEALGYLLALLEGTGGDPSDRLGLSKVLIKDQN